MVELEKSLDEAYEMLGIGNEQRDSLNLYLEVLKKRSVPTREHSVRVGLKGIEVADFTHIVCPKTLFYPGLLHDVGKALVDPETLEKTEGFHGGDMARIRRHPSYGYNLLKGIHDFSAEVLLRHHIFVGEGYPKHMPSSGIDFSNGTHALILYCARMVGLIDFYDAMMHRENDKFSPGTKRLPTREEGRGIIIGANQDQEYFLNQLYEKRIF